MWKSENLILLLVGLFSAICQGSQLEETLQLEGHRSAIYLSQIDGSEDGIVYIFEKINEKIGAYALLHYNQSYTFAYSVKKALKNAIQAKVEKNGAQNIEWKSFLETELMNIGEMVKKEDNVDLTISIVIVDGGRAIKAKSFRKDETDRKVTAYHLSKKFFFIKIGFDLDPNEEICANKKLADVKIWKGAAKMITDLAKITHENGNKAKGTIIIDLNRVYPSFKHTEPVSTSSCCTSKEDLDRIHSGPNGTILLPIPCGFTPIENSVELNGHRVAMYLLQKNDLNGQSSKKMVYLFMRITDEIGAYGLFHYKCNYDVAVAAKRLFEKAVRSNIGENGEVRVKWKSCLKKTMSEMEKIIKLMLPKDQTKSDLQVAVFVVDKDTAIGAKWYPKKSTESENSSNMKSTNIFRRLISDSVDKGILVHSSKDAQHIIMRTDLATVRNTVDRSSNMYGKIGDWKYAPKGITHSYIRHYKTKVTEAICTIVIELGFKKELNVVAKEIC